MSLSKRKYTYIDFTSEALTPVFSSANVIATGADNQVDYTRVGGTKLLDWIQTGQNDAIFPVPRTAAPLGWCLPCDANGTDGLELGEGALLNQGSFYKSFTVGTDPAFFVRARFSWLNNVDDVAACVVGFRDATTQVDVTSAAELLTSYTNTAYLGVADNAGGIYACLQKGATASAVAATHAATSTALTAATGIDFAVYVSAAGVVTFKIDGAADTLLTSGAAYTFTNATVLVPCIHLVSRNGSGNGASEVVIQEYECGHQ